MGDLDQAVDLATKLKDVLRQPALGGSRLVRDGRNVLEEGREKERYFEVFRACNEEAALLLVLLTEFSEALAISVLADGEYAGIQQADRHQILS